MSPFINTPNGPVFVPERSTVKQSLTVAKPSDLSSKSILIMDRGLKTYLAQFMARYYGAVYYHNIVGGPYEDCPKAQIGSGLPGVIHTTRPGDIIRTVSDLTVFYTDIYDGDEQEMLRHFGIAVCGSGKSEIMEMDKLFFHEAAKSAGLPQAEMHLCHGLDELWEFTKYRKEPVFAKLRDHYRGDWETTRFDDPADTENYIAMKRQHLGAKRAAEMEILCYEPIESECEAGIDGFMLNGKMANLISCGYECKDMGYVTKIMDSIPKVLQKEMDVLGPVYEGLGYRGPYSNESRITADGTAYPIDQTCRCGEPPTAVLCELLGDSYAQAIYDLARGNMPTLKAEAVYGAQINLHSDHHEDNELLVSFPEEISQWVKLENAVAHDGRFYCIPNGNCGIFGSVVAIGKSVEEATSLAMERASMIKARGMEFKPDLFDEIGKTIEAGRKFGINL